MLFRSLGGRKFFQIRVLLIKFGITLRSTAVLSRSHCPAPIPPFGCVTPTACLRMLRSTLVPIRFIKRRAPFPSSELVPPWASVADSARESKPLAQLEPTPVPEIPTPVATGVFSWLCTLSPIRTSPPQHGPHHVGGMGIQAHHAHPEQGHVLQIGRAHV